MKPSKNPTKNKILPLKGVCFNFSVDSALPLAGYKLIPLTQGKCAIVDTEDYEWLIQWKWCTQKSRGCFYAVRNDWYDKKSHTIKMHRSILKAPINQQIDHINHNGLDNRKSNLRIVSFSVNAQNSCLHKNTKSKYRGVYHQSDCKSWAARIGFNNETYHLGSFSSEIEAARAYDKKAEELFGEFAFVNFGVPGGLFYFGIKNE